MNKKGFNLLRPQVDPEDKWDRVYEWINGSARVVVIFVEIIVIACFVARIIVDQRARDLEDQLKANKIQLENLKQAEDEIIELQNLIGKYSTIWQSSTNYNAIITELYDYNPGLSPRINVEISGTRLLVSGSASRDEISDLERKMKSSNKFSSVQVTTLKTQNDQGTFQLEAEIADSKRQTIESMYQNN